MPRQDSVATSATASSLRDASPVVTQYRAVTWAVPDQPDGQQVRLVLGQPGVLGDHRADQLGALLQARRSTRSRTAGSEVRSDSKTSRNAPPGSDTKSK